MAQDPIDDYLGSITPPAPVDPIDRYVQGISPSAGDPDGEAKSAWSRALSWIEEAGRALESVTPSGMLENVIFRDRENIARSNLTQVGIASGALLKPAEAVLQIPGVLSRAFGGPEQITDRAANWMNRFQAGLLTSAEEAAIDSGMTEEQISASYDMGNFIGFTAPVTASVKGASLLLRAPTVLGRHAATGALVTDLTAGAIYGGVFKPGANLEERGKHLLEESAMFGVSRILLNAAAMPYAAYRIKRVRDLQARDSVSAILDDLEKGITPTAETSEEAVALMRLLSEENYIASSAAAQDIIARSQDESALVQAIIDVSGVSGTGGRLPGFRREFSDVVSLTDRFRQEFPALKFDVVKGREAGTYDVIFGLKGLSNKQRMQLKSQGRFEGQRVYRDGAEYEYVGAASRSGYVKLRRTDASIIEVKNENITDLPYFREVSEASPQVDALFQDFRASFEENTRKVAEASGALSEDALIRAVRDGSVKLSDDARRAFDIGGAIVYPEELGLKAGQEGIAGIRLAPAQPGATQFPQAMILRNASRGSMGMEKSWRVSYFGDDFVPAGHQSFDSIEQAVAFAQAEGWAPAEVIHNLATAGQVAQQVSRTGVEFANVLEPPKVARFEEIFDAWAASKEIAGADLPSVRDNFASRLRAEFWKMVPEEDRSVFEAIRKDLDAAIEAGEVPLEALAHQRGFHLERLEGGRISLREINTGFRVDLGSERVAQDALRSITRGEKDIFGGFMGLDSNGMPAISGGFRPTDGEWSFGPQIAAREFLDNIPQSGFRNVRDWLTSIENTTGVPLFSKGFNAIDTGLQQMRARYEPWAKEIERTWKGLSMKQKKEVVDFWQEIEGQDIALAEATKLAKERGLSPAQIKAWTRSRAIFDQGFKMAGIEQGRFISNYYGRVRPWVEKNNTIPDFERIFGAEGVPPEFNFFAEMSRTGELSMVEMDPEIVMHKWFRSMLFSQEVKPHWDRLAQLVDRGYGPFKQPALRIRDLPAAQIEQIKRLNPSIDVSDPVLAKPIRDVIAEYLTIVRGNPSTGLETLRRWNRKFFSSLGVEADDRVMEEFFNTYMSNMYGAAMAARPVQVARNMTQTIWNQYTRVGSRHMNESMAAAMTNQGFAEALEAGAVRLAESGVPYGDALFENLMANATLRGEKGPMSQAIAAAVRKGLRLGYVSRKFAEKLMIPYSSGEQMGRAWTYHWQKMHTGRLLNQYETRKIGWDKFVEDGLSFFSNPVKQEFTNLYRFEGKESALRFIGKMGADEAHFIYGVGAQPAWMQRPLGRMFGMFGTWPMWAIELYGRRFFSGTVRQRMAFGVRTLALTGAFANMSVQSGVDMWNWISPLSTLGWAGGPMADHAINTKRLVDAPLDQKAAALKRLASNMGRLSVPGQLFFHDFREAAQFDNPRDQFMRMMMGRPFDDEHYSMRFMFSGDQDPGRLLLQDPGTAEAIEGSAPSVLESSLPLPNLEGLTRKAPMGAEFDFLGDPNVQP